MITSTRTTTPVTLSSNTFRAQALARQWVALNPLFLDTETTGFGGQVIDLALVDIHGRTVLETLLKPTVAIEDGARAVHGITEAMVADAPMFDAVWDEFKALTTGKLVIIYNADFDRRVICNSATAIANLKTGTLGSEAMDWMYAENTPIRYQRQLGEPRFECAMRLYAEWKGEWGKRGYKWHKLEEAAAHCRVTGSHDLRARQEHRARSDADMARMVVLYMAGEGVGES